MKRRSFRRPGPAGTVTSQPGSTAEQLRAAIAVVRRATPRGALLPHVALDGSGMREWLASQAYPEWDRFRTSVYGAVEGSRYPALEMAMYGPAASNDLLQMMARCRQQAYLLGLAVGLQHPELNKPAEDRAGGVR